MSADESVTGSDTVDEYGGEKECGHMANFNSTILVAEDNPINQEVAKMMLEVMGCRVDQAENGVKAVEMAHSNCYDLILMDCQMPVMDGFNATAIIREREEENNKRIGGGKRVKIIAMTGNTADEDRAHCISKGMDGFLRKPFTFEEMESLLKCWLLSSSVRPSENDKQELLSEQNSTIDTKYLDNIRSLQREGAPDILAKVIDNFFQEAPPAIKRLEEAVAVDDGESIRAIAHRFKSGSANLGALRLAELFYEMEKGAFTNGAVGNKDIMSRISAEYEMVNAELTRIRNEGC